MNRINRLLKMRALIVIGISLFGSSLVISMDNPDEEITQANSVVFGDEYEWTECNQMEKIENFAGMVVACKFAKPPVGGMFQTNNGIWLGVVSKPSACANNKLHYTLYQCKPLKDPGFGVTFGTGSISLDSDNKLSVRRLTLDEAYQWDQAIETGKITYPRECIWQTLKLENLMPDEQKKYCRNKVLKTFWAKQRLLHLGQKDKGSPLNCLPKDLVTLISQYFFNAEAAHFGENKPLMLLLFDKKNSKSELP